MSTLQQNSLTLTSSSGNNDIDRFKQWQREGRLILIRFYATWCGHCNHMEKDWESFLASIDFSRMSALRVASVESELLAALELEDEVPLGYPTIKIYQGTQLKDEFQGAREESAFHTFTTNVYDSVYDMKATTQKSLNTKSNQRKSVRGGRRGRRGSRRQRRSRRSRRRAHGPA